MQPTLKVHGQVREGSRAPQRTKRLRSPEVEPGVGDDWDNLAPAVQVKTIPCTEDSGFDLENTPNTRQPHRDFSFRFG